MTHEFECFLKLLAIGAGAAPDDRHPQLPVDMDAIVKVAAMQSSFHLCYAGLKQVYKAWNVDENFYYSWKMRVLKDVLKNNKKRIAATKILKSLEESGFSYALLKGESIAACYKHPELRIVLDMDILIDPSDEKRVLRHLEEMGMKNTLRHAGDHHTHSYSEETGMIEVHIKPYEDIFDEIWFCEFQGLKNILDTKLRYDNNPQTGGYYTLPYQDSLHQITFHFLKHFIVGSASVRQILDILLFCKKHEEHLDWTLYAQVLKDSGYSKLMETVWYIGKRYFNIDVHPSEDVSPEKMQQLQNLAEKLLTNMENTTKHKNDEAFKSLWITYSQMKYQKTNQKSSFLYMLRWRLARILQVLFPPVNYLLDMYSGDKPTGVVRCWFRHIALYLKQFRNKEKRGKDILLFTDDNSENVAAKEHIGVLKDFSIL